MVSTTTSRIDLEAVAFNSQDAMVLQTIQSKYPWFSELDLIEAISMGGDGLSKVLTFLEEQGDIWKD